MNTDNIIEFLKNPQQPLIIVCIVVVALCSSIVTAFLIIPQQLAALASKQSVVASNQENDEKDIAVLKEIAKDQNDKLGTMQQDVHDLRLYFIPQK